MVCDYSIDEMRRVYNRKFPHKPHMMAAFLSTMLLSVEVVTTPPEDESVDDRDFLESGLTHPLILSPAEFLEMK